MGPRAVLLSRNEKSKVGKQSSPSPFAYNPKQKHTKIPLKFGSEKRDKHHRS